MHADAAWDHPGRNVCDPSMRNSQELSAGIKLICRPQAKACKHTGRSARVAEIGLSLPPFLSSLFLSSSLSRTAAPLAYSALALLFLCFHFHISIFIAPFLFLSPAVLSLAQLYLPSPFTFSFPPNLTFLSSFSLAWRCLVLHKFLVLYFPFLCSLT